KGYPVDYDAQLTKETLALNVRIKPDFMGMSFFYPFPGTQLYDYCIEHDKIDPVKFDTISVPKGGKNYNVVSDNIIALLGSKLIKELAEVILSENQLSEEERKN
ncbi:MAG: hypothetical protein ACTSSP_06655, partial [Candidatus Asgardarchaeia archaeon]